MLSTPLPPVTVSELRELETPSFRVIDEGISVTVADADCGTLCLDSVFVG